jgi:23S rRNA pseudouridine2605 synthase
VRVRKNRHVGLARVLSKLGYCSRSRAIELIRAGRVNLNGRIIRDPEAAVRERCDRIVVDGSSVEPQKKLYLMLNKPRGVVTTASDEKGRETVYDVLNGKLQDPDGKNFSADSQHWLAPVGRLDKASEGLVLLTNDSEWGARIAAPETHLDKTYHVQIGALADEILLESMRRGVTTKSGEAQRVKSARLLRSGEKNCWVEIVLDEGKNRQIRRIFEAMGIEVLRLVRVGIGPLLLGNLGKSDYRWLSNEEKRMLDRAMGKRLAAMRKRIHE